MSTDDPAYQHELEELLLLCRGFIAARESENFEYQLLIVGAIIAQCANIYLLSPPAGILDPAEMFRREPLDGS